VAGLSQQEVVRKKQSSYSNDKFNNTVNYRHPSNTILSNSSAFNKMGTVKQDLNLNMFHSISEAENQRSRSNHQPQLSQSNLNLENKSKFAKMKFSRPGESARS